jgi:RNA polymerase sigma-70 factor (sigma-E family)
MDEVETAERPGVQEAMRVAFEQHYLPLLKLSVALSGRHDTAEDLVQEAFVRSAARITQLEPHEIRPYLRRVVVNLWKNRLRRFAIEGRHSISLLGRDRELDAPLEERDLMWKALMKLPARQRACLVLRFYEDLPDPEIARVLGCSVGTVKSQASRALAKLRKAMTHED